MALRVGRAAMGGAPRGARGAPSRGRRRGWDAAARCTFRGIRPRASPRRSRARGAASLVVGGIVALDVVRFVVVVGSAGSPPGAHGRPPDVPAAVARRLRAPLVHGGVPAGDIDVLRHAGQRRLPTALRRLGVTDRHPPQRLSGKLTFSDRTGRGEACHLLSLIHISEPTRQEAISYAVFCLKKKK